MRTKYWLISTNGQSPVSYAVDLHLWSHQHRYCHLICWIMVLPWRQRVQTMDRRRFKSPNEGLSHFYCALNDAHNLRRYIYLLWMVIYLPKWSVLCAHSLSSAIFHDMKFTIQGASKHWKMHWTGSTTTAAYLRHQVFARLVSIFHDNTHSYITSSLSMHLVPPMACVHW